MPASTRERLDRHDREVAAIRELIREGVRLGIETRKDLHALAALQKKIDTSLKGRKGKLR